jgi:hypothetical protein
MSELEEALYTRLSNYAGLSVLVGARIYPIKMPEAPTYPCVTYQRVDTVREHGMTADHGLTHPRMQVDSWAVTFAAAKAVGEQVRLALQRWDDVTSSPVVLDSFLDNTEDTFESGANIYRVRHDFIVWHRE